MALSELYFSVIRNAGLADASTVINLVGQHLKARLCLHDYGSGVAWIIVFVALLERSDAPFRRKHTYEPGKRTVKTEGVEYDVEDVLKIFIAPDVVSMRSATSVGDIVELIKKAFLGEREGLLGLNVPNFDAPLFFSDVIVELDTIAKSPAWWHRLGGVGRLGGGVPEGTARKCSPSAKDFPAAVLAFVEQELPFVSAAAQRKDRKALMPLINRMNEFVKPWADVMGPKGPIFENFPDCAHLVVNLGREIAIECDDQLPSTERQRLHLEFQERLAACRECARRIKKSLE